MTETASVAPLDPEASGKLTEFARACRTAARAVALYPGTHPSIQTSIRRLVETAAHATADGALTLQVLADRLLVGGAAPARPDAALAELADLLHRHQIGGMVLHGATDADSWRAFLLLLARPPEEVRADGGLGHLWKTAGGPSIELQEIDYAGVLRERGGAAAAIEEIITACLQGAAADVSDDTLAELLETALDPEAFEALVLELAGRAGEEAPEALLHLLRALIEFVSRTDPARLPDVLRRAAAAAATLPADALAGLLERRGAPEADVGGVDAVGAVTSRIDDDSIARFVANSVLARRGPSDRLAEAFQALVPEGDRQRQLLALAGERVAATPLGSEESFPELWGRVEQVLSSYSDESFVSRDYGRELSGAREQAMQVERVSDDPPERIAVWLGTVSDAALRGLDQLLLLDLLAIEGDLKRWRDLAATVIDHINDLARVDHVEPAWQLVSVLVKMAESGDPRRDLARQALGRLSGGPMLRRVASGAGQEDDARLDGIRRLCLAIGPPAVPTLAELLAVEQHPGARQRLRGIILGYGPAAREQVQQLMSAASWELRRTAASLLREFGASEDVPALAPLLSDAEPRVQREALRALALSGSEQAYEVVLAALRTASIQVREALTQDLRHLRDERAAPLFEYLVRRLDWRASSDLYAASVEALGAIGGSEAVEPLKGALYHGIWWAPLRTRAHRQRVADALRRIGTAEALDALREAAEGGPAGVRAISREQLARSGGGGTGSR